MGFGERVNEDGSVTRYGDTPTLICQFCNEMPEFDSTVRIINPTPLQWQCEKCYSVNG